MVTKAGYEVFLLEIKHPNGRVEEFGSEAELLLRIGHICLNMFEAKHKAELKEAIEMIVQERLDYSQYAIAQSDQRQIIREELYKRFNITD